MSYYGYPYNQESPNRPPLNSEGRTASSQATQAFHANTTATSGNWSHARPPLPHPSNTISIPGYRSADAYLRNRRTGGGAGHVPDRSNTLPPLSNLQTQSEERTPIPASDTHWTGSHQARQPEMSYTIAGPAITFTPTNLHRQPQSVPFDPRQRPQLHASSHSLPLHTERALTSGPWLNHSSGPTPPQPAIPSRTFWSTDWNEMPGQKPWEDRGPSACSQQFNFIPHKIFVITLPGGRTTSWNSSLKASFGTLGIEAHFHQSGGEDYTPVFQAVKEGGITDTFSLCIILAQGYKQDGRQLVQTTPNSPSQGRRLGDLLKETANGFETIQSQGPIDFLLISDDLESSRTHAQCLSARYRLITRLRGENFVKAMQRSAEAGVRVWTTSGTNSDNLLKMYMAQGAPTQPPVRYTSLVKGREASADELEYQNHLWGLIKAINDKKQSHRDQVTISDVVEPNRTSSAEQAWTGYMNNEHFRYSLRSMELSGRNQKKDIAPEYQGRCWGISRTLRTGL